MSQTTEPTWPFILRDNKRYFLNPAPSLRAPQWSEPWIITGRRGTKRRCGEEDKVPAPSRPSTPSPTPASLSYRSSQIDRVRKSRAGPRYVDHASFRPRISDSGAHIIDCQLNIGNYISHWMRRHIPDRTDLSAKLMVWLRNELAARMTKRFRRHLHGEKETRNPHDSRTEEAQKKNKKYQASAEDAENSEEVFPARKKQRPDAGVVLNDAEAEEEFELDVEWTPGQPGIVSGGPLYLRDSRGKKLRVVDKMPMVIACADGPVIVEEEDGRTLVRDGKDQDVIYNEDEDEEMPDYDDSNDDESLNSDSSDSLSSSGSYPGELQVPPSPPTTTILPWYLIPARIPKSSNTGGKNQNKASASQRGIRTSTKSNQQLTLNKMRPARPSRLFIQSQLLSRFPLPTIPSPTVTPLRMPTSSPVSPIHTPTETSGIWQNAIANAKAEGVRLEAKRAVATKLAAERRRSAQILGRAKNPLVIPPVSVSASVAGKNTATKSAKVSDVLSREVWPRTSSNSKTHASRSPHRTSKQSPSMLLLSPLEASLNAKMQAYNRQSRISQAARLRDNVLRGGKADKQSSPSSKTKDSVASTKTSSAPDLPLS